MEYDLDWSPSLDPVVNPHTARIPRKSIIDPRRVPLALAVASQTYNFGKKFNIKSVEQASSPEAKNGWKAGIRVSASLDGTAENFCMLSCKSLICLYGQEWSFICNPTTRECQPLVRLHERDGIGFGFDATKNQYKLVLLHLSSGSTWCEIFTLGLNSWTSAKYDDPTVPTYKGKASCATTIGETIYWITTHRSRVLSFNVRTGRFKLICAPIYIQGRKTRLEQNIHISLTQLSGKLCLVQHNGAAKTLDIWTKSEAAGTFCSDKPPWTPRSSIDLNTDFLPDHTLPGYHVTVVGYLGGKIIFMSTWKGLVSYDEKTRKFGEVYLPSGCWCQTVVYTKSSTPLKDILTSNELGMTKFP